MKFVIFRSSLRFIRMNTYLKPFAALCPCILFAPFFAHWSIKFDFAFFHSVSIYFIGFFFPAYDCKIRYIFIYAHAKKASDEQNPLVKIRIFYVSFNILLPQSDQNKKGSNTHTQTHKNQKDHLTLTKEVEDSDLNKCRNVAAKCKGKTNINIRARMHANTLTESNKSVSIFFRRKPHPKNSPP